MSTLIPVRPLGEALAYARENRARFVDELRELVRFPTVGAQAEHAHDVERCAHWLTEHLRGLGLQAKLVRTAGHPLVYAEWRRAPGRATVLVYGHYDVQPPDPLDEWISPPFEPVVRGQDLLGRGACDDKGQMWVHVKALEALLRTRGDLPVNVICLFEGEEESGSGGLLAFLRDRGGTLDADLAVISDMRMRSAVVPAITYALRGALSLEVEVRGPREDLHSGLFGGCIHNPLQVLCELVSRLHDTRGRIAIPGFYDRVRPPRSGERRYLGRTGPADAEILRDAGAERGWGEKGYSAYERCTLRPSLSVNGISGGYAGEGVKAVIPARAVAKLSFRLVADQEPEEIDQLFRRQLARLAPPTVRVGVRTAFGARPAHVDPTHPALRAAAVALRQAFGCAPAFVRSGGTIPVVSALLELGIPTLLMGFARPDDRIHAPNEKFHLPNLFRGIEASLRLLTGLGARAATPLHGPLTLHPTARPS